MASRWLRIHKFDFYQRHGVEEYYLYNPDPDRLELSGFLRNQNKLTEIPAMHGHVSRRLTVKFEMSQDGLRIIRPDGQPFTTFAELAERADRERQRADRLATELDQLRRQSGSSGPQNL